MAKTKQTPKKTPKPKKKEGGATTQGDGNSQPTNPPPTKP